MYIILDEKKLPQVVYQANYVQNPSNKKLSLITFSETEVPNEDEYMGLGWDTKETKKLLDRQKS